MKIFVVLLSLMLFISPVFGANNEVSGYLQYGENTVDGSYGSFAGFYKRSTSTRFDLTGGLHLSTKNPYGFGGLMADGTYRIPVNRANILISNRLVYNYYGKSEMNEFLYRLAVTWQTRYVELTFGNSFLTYWSYGSAVFEPVTLTIGANVHLKPRESSWNVGLYLKNYDDFIYENFNINFGIDGRYDLQKDFTVFGAFMIRPAGSLNQLAVKYDVSLRLGVKYKW